MYVIMQSGRAHAAALFGVVVASLRPPAALPFTSSSMPRCDWPACWTAACWPMARFESQNKLLDVLGVLGAIVFA